MTEGTAEKQTHYQKAAMQPIEVMQCLFTKEQFEGFLLGNCVKYQMRAPYKGSPEADEEKARQYFYWYCLVKDSDHRIDPLKDVPPKDWKIGDGMSSSTKEK